MNEIKNKIDIELNKCNDSIVLQNVLSLLQRSNVGVEKYGTTLDRKDLTESQWKQHLLEELLDASNYIRRIM